MGGGGSTHLEKLSCSSLDIFQRDGRGGEGAKIKKKGNFHWLAILFQKKFLKLSRTWGAGDPGDLHDQMARP